MKSVSIIVPFYKGLNYLDDCFNSIMNQCLDVEDYEVLCLGDAPEEGIVSKIEQFEKLGFPVRYVQWLEHKGTGYARNKGIEMAEGEFLYFLDSDDFLLDGCLKRMLKCARDNSADVIRGTIRKTNFKLGSFDPTEYMDKEWITSDKKGNDTDLVQFFSKEITALHLLIKRDLVMSRNIRFADDVYYFSDMPFVMQLLAEAKSFYLAADARLAKRRRNDPIHLPSLKQYGRKHPEEFISDLIKVYYISLEYAGDQPKRRNIVKNILCYNINSAFNHGWNLSDSLSQECSKALRDAVKDVGARYGTLGKMVLSLTASGKIGLAKKICKISKIRHKKSGKFGSKIQWYRLLDKVIFRHMRRKNNLVVFESFFGKDYNDSPKYIYEYMLETFGNKYKYVWILNNPSENMKGNPKIARYSSLKHVYYSTRAKYHVYNVRQPGWFKKEKDMVILETWHGTPLKKLAFDLDDIHAASQNQKETFYRDTRLWDYLISANPFSTEVFARAFDLDRNMILEHGYPRNDLMYSDNAADVAADVRKKLGIPEGKKVLLYAPTWRDNEFYGPGRYKFSLAIDFNQLRSALSDEWVILMRTHYHIADRIDFSEFAGFVYNVSKYEDVTELYLISDVCMTDYSSVFFDYANLKRPMIFYVYDFEEYKDELRGMYLDMETELPGPLLKTEKEVINAIKNIDKVEAEYADRYAQFYDRFCCRDDGNATKRVVEAVFGGGKHL